MNQVFLSDSCYVYFGTSSATTGAATNADSTPTVTVAEDGTDLGYVPTVTNVAVGLYKAQIDATAANGFEAGRRYNAYAVATVGAVTGRDGVGEFEVLAVDMNTALDAAITSRMATYVQPTGFLAATFPATVASTTNITAGTITTTTNLTNLPTIPANWITAAGITAAALNGKGDWATINPTNLTAAQIATGVWTDTTAGDFTVALSVGKSVMNGVSLGTGLTINAYTGDTPQTGDSFARIGAAGASLTAIDLPDQTMNITGNITGNLSGSVGSVTGLTAANLDVAVSTRMASYTQPTGFLAATFPLTVASPTNITAGTITTTTNLTNLPAIPVDWLTAAGIAADAVTEIQAGLSTLTQANIRTAVGLATANLDTQLDALPTAAEVVAAQLTTAITEAYRANGAAPTLAQFMSEVLGHLGEMSISGVTKTIKKFDHTSVAETFTLDSATTPAAIERTT